MALAFVVSWQLLSPRADADIISTFDTNLEGWTLFQNSGPNFNWVANGGNPGGHLGVTDNTSDWAYVQAPTTFLTPARYNGTFSFDLKHDNLQEPPGFPGIFNVRVAMQGAGLTLINEGALPTLNWANYSFQLNESAGAGWRKFSNLSQNYSASAPLATLAEMQSVLGGLSRLLIATDYTLASTDSNVTQIDRTYIDNVRLTTIPEPSIGLLGSVVVLCGALLRRNRKHSNGNGSRFLSRSPSSLIAPRAEQITMMPGCGARSVTRSLILVVVIAATFSARPVPGQILEWNNATNSNAWFENPFNWTPNAVPGPGSALSFDLSSTYHVFWNPNTSLVSPTIHTMYVTGGGNVTFTNVNPAQQYQLESLGGLGPAGNFSPVNVQGSTLTLNGLHLLARGTVNLSQGGVLNIDGLHPAGSRLTVEGSLSLDGSMNVSGPNAVVTSVNSRLGWTSTTIATVSGTGARWDNAEELIVGAGWANGNTGTLNVLAGGVVTSEDTKIGDSAGPFFRANGVVTVSGGGSWLASTSDLVVGSDGGNGALNVAAGGLVTSTTGVIGDQSGSSGTATVTGTDSRWLVSDLLKVGSGGSAILDIVNGGRVSVAPGGTTAIEAGSSVHISGASSRFEFGQTTIAEFARITGSSGSLAGTINHAGYTNVASLNSLQNPNLDMSDVNLVNSGGLHGNAALQNSLTNTLSGEVETIGSERMRFAGSGTNAGQINIFGGQVRFAGTFENVEGGEVHNFGQSFVADNIQNYYGGLISGRGQFVAANGWSNQGVMAFSDGTTDIVGDVYNQEGATIVTSGNGTTTFYGDFYQENAGSVRTSAGSSTVFFGEVSGAGLFVGDGTVFLEGDLRPGNSPGTMSFGGDLVLSSRASTLIELGGLEIGNFDRLLIGGDLFLGNSSLDVALWNGFDLGANMQFLFADVEGDLFGQFSGLGEGSLVGNFGGTNLFITYQGFDGNGGVGLFTSAVPEPATFVLLGMASLLGLASQRRRKS